MELFCELFSVCCPERVGNPMQCFLCFFEVAEQFFLVLEFCKGGIVLFPPAVDLRLCVGKLLFGVSDGLVVKLFRLVQLAAFFIKLFFGGSYLAAVFLFRVIVLFLAVGNLSARVVKLRFTVGNFIPVFLLSVFQLLFCIAKLPVGIFFFGLIGFLRVIELCICLIDDLDLKRFLAFAAVCSSLSLIFSMRS